MEPTIRIIAWISSALMAAERPPGIVYEAASMAKIMMNTLRLTSGNISLRISAAE